MGKVDNQPILEANGCRARTKLNRDWNWVAGAFNLPNPQGDRVLTEAEFLNRHERMRNQLMEIEAALGRIENGSFGVCEETEEAIEPERLRAIPWTRLSIEGAEIRESMNKRFAR